MFVSVYLSTEKNKTKQTNSEQIHRPDCFERYQKCPQQRKFSIAEQMKQ